jgi:hypothetical protein
VFSGCIQLAGIDNDGLAVDQRILKEFLEHLDREKWDEHPPQIRVASTHSILSSLFGVPNEARYQMGMFVSPSEVERCQSV